MSELLYFLGFFATFGLYDAWFASRLPIHMFQILWRLGWRHNRPDFWPEEGVKHWMRDEWEMWVALAFRGPWWMPIGELLICPHCLHYHMAFWISLLLALGSGDWWLVPICTFTWPGVIRMFSSIK